MTRDLLSRHPCLALFLGFLCLLPACSEEEVIPGSGPLRVRMILETPPQEPVEGIKCVLMSLDSNVPVSGPVVSGPDGICDFGYVSRKNTRPMVFCGDEYRVQMMPRYGWAAGQDAKSGGTDRTGWALTPPEPAPAEVWLRPRNQPGGLPRISGRVLDAETDEPLGRVFLSTSPFPVGYEGSTNPSDDVTMADGVYSVSDIPFLVHPVTRNLTQAVPLVVTRHGYRPRLFFYEPPNGSGETDFRDVTIRLEKLDTAGRGSLTGKVARQGDPVPGVLVGLGYVGPPEAAKGAAGLTGWTARSDTAGVFLFEDLPAGQYLVHAGFLLHDGVYMPSASIGAPLEVLPDSQTASYDIEVLHEIDAWWGSGWNYGPVRSDILLTWSAVEGAADYLLSMDGEIKAPVAEAEFTIPQDSWPSPGLHSWKVLARDRDETAIGLMQVDAYFRVVED